MTRNRVSDILKSILTLTCVGFILYCSANSAAQDKPWPITSNEPDHLDLAVDKIYLRVRERVDSLVNDYLKTKTILVDTVRGKSAESVTIGVQTLKTTRLDNTAGVAGVWFGEAIDNGTDAIKLSPPASMSGSKIVSFQDNFGTIALTSDVWSRTGDTLMQSGIVSIAATNTEDTIGVPTAYSAANYKVFLTWANNGSSPPPAGAADTLWNVVSGALTQYKVDSFRVQVPYASTKVLNWITIGN